MRNQATNVVVSAVLQKHVLDARKLIGEHDFE
jgi:hypothetical protein